VSEQSVGTTLTIIQIMELSFIAVTGIQPRIAIPLTGPSTLSNDLIHCLYRNRFAIFGLDDPCRPELAPVI